MKRSSLPSTAPPRWIDGSDDTALSLRAYEQAVRGKPSVAFEHFIESRSKRKNQARVGWALALALVSGGVMAAMGSDVVASWFGRSAGLEIAAETFDPSSARGADGPASKTAATSGPRPSGERREVSQPGPVGPATSSTGVADRGASEPSAAERGVNERGAAVSAAKSPKAASEVQSKAPLHDCQELAAKSQFNAAASCYGKIAATGSSTTAELAWLEKARLEARALGRADLALQTLAAYKAKFPKGALAHEASVAEKRNLAALQRKQGVSPKPTAP